MLDFDGTGDRAAYRRRIGREDEFCGLLYVAVQMTANPCGPRVKLGG